MHRGSAATAEHNRGRNNSATFRTRAASLAGTPENA
jgi:hypothetical protein